MWPNTNTQTRSIEITISTEPNTSLLHKIELNSPPIQHISTLISFTPAHLQSSEHDRNLSKATARDSSWKELSGRPCSNGANNGRTGSVDRPDFHGPEEKKDSKSDEGNCVLWTADRYVLLLSLNGNADVFYQWFSLYMFFVADGVYF